MNLASDVMEGQNVKQAFETRPKSAGRNMVQNVLDSVGPSGERPIKALARTKKHRRRKTAQQISSKDIFD